VRSELARQHEATGQKGESRRFRRLALLEAYYHGAQYDFLPRAWDEDLDSAGNAVPFRQRRPSTIRPVPRIVVEIFCRALWGRGRRPKATIPGAGPEANAYVDDIIAEAKLARVMADATRRGLRIGTGVVVWRLRDGKLAADAWDAKCCRPTFAPGAFPELASLDYRFKYTREVEGDDGRVKPVEFWHREVLDAKSWVIYRDVEVSASSAPTWVADTALTHEHGLGFCPAIWFIVDERQGDDGTGVYEPYIGLIDELNYTASQEGRALYYNLDPQAVLSGVQQSDIGQLKKGGSNTWFLPEKASAQLLESSGSYIDAAERRQDELKKDIYDAAGVVLPDPERVKGAQSGASLELLAAPQAARVDELRDDVGDAYIRLLEQILGALSSPGLAADKVKINVRDGDVKRPGATGRIKLTWGAHFPRTPTDATAAADTVVKATSAGVLSRAAGARYLAPFVGVEDVEADQAEVEADQGREDARLERMEKARASCVDLPPGPPEPEES
jgi:hypothetical protein